MMSDIIPEPTIQNGGNIGVTTNILHLSDLHFKKGITSLDQDKILRALKADIKKNV